MSDDVLLHAVALVVAEHAARIVGRAADEAAHALDEQQRSDRVRRSSRVDYRAGWLDCVAHLRRYADDLSTEDSDW